MLITKRLAIVVTLKCTLNCKLCCNCVPLYKNKPILNVQSILDDMATVFKIYDRIEWLQFVGGELFLHPDMGKILLECKKYNAQFDKIILMTNGTIIPKQAVLEAMAEHKEKLQVQISDYGPLSAKAKELEAVLTEQGIDFVTKSFYGNIQHYGGWVDCGNFEDQGHNEEEVQSVFDGCWQIQLSNLHAYNGKLHNCPRSLFGGDLGPIDVPENEYVDLKSKAYTLEQKREIAENFGKHPLHACYYCRGFDSKNAQRYPAAEQVR